MSFRLSDFEKGELVQLIKEGVSVQEIAQRMGRSRRTISRLVKLYDEGGENALLAKRFSPGKPKTLSTSDVRKLEAELRKDPFKTASTASKELALPTTIQNVRRRLRKETTLECRRPARKPALTQDHIQERLNFCANHANTDWSLVIFSDEKTFSTDEVPRNLRVWRDPNTRFHPQNIAETRRSGRLTAGYWGWMSEAGPGELVSVGPRMTSAEYVDILEDVLLPSIQAVYGSATVKFVQDNSPIHTARIVKDWFANHPQVELITWPARSPDLNVIENVWAQMVKDWPSKDLKTLTHLDTHVKAVWNNMRGTNFCSKLVDSMPSRLQQCQASNGYWIKY